jgi:hypothetical protein
MNNEESILRKHLNFAEVNLLPDLVTVCVVECVAPRLLTRLGVQFTWMESAVLHTMEVTDP